MSRVQVFGSGLCCGSTHIRSVADSECSSCETLQTDLYSPEKILNLVRRKVWVFNSGYLAQMLLIPIG